MVNSQISDIPVKNKENEGQDFVRSATFERGVYVVPGYNVLMVARIKGQFSETALKTAIQKIWRHHPLLRVHMEIDEHDNSWFTSRNTLDIPLKVYARTSDKVWLDACHTENKIRFHLDTDPLFRVIWVKESSISELILFAQHSICDGTSLVFLMRDLLMYLANPTMDVKVQDNLPTLDKAVDLDRIKPSRFVKVIQTKFMNLWKKNEIHFSFEDFEPLKDTFDACNGQILTYELSQEDTEKLTQLSRNHKVTVNSVLYSALISAQLEIQGGKKKYLQKILMPINFREYINPPIGEVVGFYAGGEYFPHKVKLKKNFWKRTLNLHKLLRKHVNLDGMLSNVRRNYTLPSTLLDARSMLIYGKHFAQSSPKYNQLLEIVNKYSFLRNLHNEYLKEDMVLGLALTNLGKIDIPTQYGELKLESLLFIPPANFTSEKIVGVVTVGGKLNIAFSYLEKYIPTEIVQRELNRTIEILKLN